MIINRNNFIKLLFILVISYSSMSFSESLSVKQYEFLVGGENNSIIYKYSINDKDNPDAKADVFYQNYQMKDIEINGLTLEKKDILSFNQGVLTFRCQISVNQCKPLNILFSAYSDSNKVFYFVLNKQQNNRVYYSNIAVKNRSFEEFPSGITGLVVQDGKVIVSTKNNGLFIAKISNQLNFSEIKNASKNINAVYYDKLSKSIFIDSNAQFSQCILSKNNQYSCQLINNQICNQFSSIKIMSEKDTNFTNSFFNYMKNNAYGSFLHDSWGPKLKPTPIYVGQINADRSIPLICVNNDQFLQGRILDITDYIISLKFNYCYHHLPYVKTPNTQIGKNERLHYCSNEVNLEPSSIFYKKPIRWNYVIKDNQDYIYTLNHDAINTESIISANAKNAQDMLKQSFDSWQDQARWYGIDCSDLTFIAYNYALGNQASALTSEQAGQSQSIELNDKLDVTSVAKNVQGSSYGEYLCSNGKLANNGKCSNNAKLISVWQSDKKNPVAITDKDIALFQPGDLLFITGNIHSPLVTHVAIWTGKKVGNGKNEIPKNLIAPNSICSKVINKDFKKDHWLPKDGDWVIMDSHYQGPDYRVFSSCFYKYNIWAVKRVIKSDNKNSKENSSINNIYVDAFIPKV